MNEAKRKANNKWDAANMTLIAAKVRKDYAEKFRAACKAAGTTPNAVLKAAADDFMAHNNAAPVTSSAVTEGGVDSHGNECGT